jgi:hypothetical protein
MAKVESVNTNPSNASQARHPQGVGHLTERGHARGRSGLAFSLDLPLATTL